MTKKLYYNDPYATTFKATVLSCAAFKGGFAVVLDQSLFYPEGGGQPFDTGYLDDVSVTEVHEKDGIVLHQTAAPLAVGAQVFGKIDWARRFDFMQNHSGEHILSGIICKKYRCDNVGFHMGRENITIDLNCKIPMEDLPWLEETANEAIWNNTPIEITYPSQAERDALDYRSKIELSGEVRIVTAGAYDCCACCGTHVKLAGEIGIIKIVGAQNYKGGTRLTLLCGKRALTHYRKKNDAADGVGVLLSVPGEGILPSVAQLLSQKEELLQQLGRLKAERFATKVNEMPLDMTKVCYFEENLSGKDLTALGDKLLAKVGGQVAVLTPAGAGFAFVLLSAQGDARALTEELKKVVSCKGGGKAEAVQGLLQGTLPQILGFFQDNGFYVTQA